MLGKVQTDARLTRYLLGAVSETEREDIESKLFTDEGVFEEVLIAEDELVDAYARGELSDQERRQFEKHFLTSSRGRERVHFTNTLAAAIADERPKVRSVAQETSPSFFTSLWAGLTQRRLATVSLSALVVVAFAWLLVDRGRMRTELQELRAEQARLTEKSQELQRNADAERARSAELAVQLQAERERPVEQVVKNEQKTVPREVRRGQEPDTSVADATIGSSSSEFELNPSSTRGAGGTTLAVPRSARSVILKLGFERPSLHQEYRAIIETPEGRRVWSADSFGARQSPTELNSVVSPPIPTRDLRQGDYILLLSGKRADGNFETVANYSFRITRK